MLCYLIFLLFDFLLVVGFTGDVCETNINDCEGRECNDGVCVDGINQAFCQCQTGKAGADCTKGNVTN